MTPVPQDPDKKRQEQLKKFHEQSLAGAQEQKNKELRKRAEHRGEEHGGEEWAAQQVKADDAALAKRKEGVRAWRATEKQRKADIMKDKEERAETARKLKERKEKERVYTEKQHKFFESFRAAASKKAQGDRKKYERDQELKAELLRVETHARDMKWKADSDETRLKNDVEHDGLRKRDELTREYRQLEEKLFADETRQKTAFAAMGPAAKPRLDALAKEMEKKRGELRAEQQRRRALLDQDIAKKKTDVERQIRKRKAEIDAEVVAKKTAINAERKKLQ